MNCGDEAYDMVVATFDVTLRLLEHQQLLNSGSFALSNAKGADDS
jgi:hypothetical protein